MTIGKFIRDRRENLGLSQSQLARDVGLTATQFISNIERGVAGVPAARLGRFAKALRVPTKKFIALHLEWYAKQYTKRVGGA